MSYQKHIWVTKEVISSKNLNHIEDGIYNEEQRAIGEEQELLEAINTLNGNSSVVGSVDYKIAQAMSNVTVLNETLAANASIVTFTGIPTSGNYMIDFFIEGGANYTAINTATSGQITLTYESIGSDRSVYCRIEGVS